MILEHHAVFQHKQHLSLQVAAVVGQGGELLVVDQSALVDVPFESGKAFGQQPPLGQVRDALPMTFLPSHVHSKLVEDFLQHGFSQEASSNHFVLTALAGGLSCMQERGKSLDEMLLLDIGHDGALAHASQSPEMAGLTQGFEGLSHHRRILHANADLQLPP